MNIEYGSRFGQPELESGKEAEPQKSDEKLEVVGDVIDKDQSESLERDWQLFLEDSFTNHRADLRRFAAWLLNKESHRFRLHIKNLNKEDIVEDIIQNTYLRLLRLNTETKKDYLNLDAEQQKQYVINEIKWASGRYFTYPVAGPVGYGTEYPHTQDVYVHTDALLLEFDRLHDRDIESAENQAEPTTRAKASSPEALFDKNPYVEIEKRLDNEKLNALIESHLDKMTAEQADVLRMRMGLSPYKSEYTLREIAEKNGVSKARISQIYIQALRILRHPTRARGLAKLASDVRILEQLKHLEHKEQLKHYFRYYIYDDGEYSGSGAPVTTRETAIRNAQEALKDALSKMNSNQFLRSAVQEVDDSQEKDGEKIQRFRTVWEGDQDAQTGTYIDGAWMEDRLRGK